MDYDIYMGAMMGNFTGNHHNIASIRAWDGHIRPLYFNLYPPGTPSPERPSRSQGRAPPRPPVSTGGLFMILAVCHSRSGFDIVAA